MPQAAFASYYALKSRLKTSPKFRILRRPARACLDRIPVRKMHAELWQNPVAAEPLTFQRLSENTVASSLKLGREFGSILENQEIGVRAGAANQRSAQRS